MIPLPARLLDFGVASVLRKKPVQLPRAVL
jgi:hypothetical protein